jgi:hypothetical protein
LPPEEKFFNNTLLQNHHAIRKDSREFRDLEKNWLQLLAAKHAKFRETGPLPPLSVLFFRALFRLSRARFPHSSFPRSSGLRPAALRRLHTARVKRVPLREDVVHDDTAHAIR